MGRCGSSQDNLSQYWNDEWKYGIKVPEDWVLQEDVSANASFTVLLGGIEPAAAVSILVINTLAKVDFDPDFPGCVQRAAETERRVYGAEDIIVLDNRATQGDWDWHLSYECFRNDELYHVEHYFLCDFGYYCHFSTDYPKKDYGLYPWNQIIESFRFEPILLLPPPQIPLD